MKNIIFILTLAFSISFTFTFAQEVSLDEARNAAIKVFSETKSKSFSEVQIKDVYYRKDIGESAGLYIFNESSGGFVIISGEQRTVPVLGFSAEESMSMNESSWSPSFIYWIQTYCNQIEHIRANSLSPTQDVIEQRTKLNNNENLGLVGSKDVAPLLSTAWNQGCGYNSLCPADPAGPCGRVYTGCVATAMAQVMRYLEHPVNGTGDKCYTLSVYGEQCADFSIANYDYATMPNNSGNAAVAKLMYHCGVSVNMNYSPSGSGAFSHSVPTAYRNYFDYKNAVILGKGNYTDDAWNSILRNEIDNNRPFYYAGQNATSGHAFVFDGYQGLDYFHIDWGWGGAHNGYFYCSNLNPGSSSFTNNQRAVIGTIPSPVFVNLNTFPSTELICATPLSQDLASGTDYFNYYKNTYPATPGKELVYHFTTTLPGRIRVKTSNATDGELFVFLLHHHHQDSLIAFGVGDIIQDDMPAGTYYVVVESNTALEPEFDIEVICPTIDADLIITSTNVNPQYLISNQTNVNFQSIVKNIGNTTASVNTINYYLSDDDVYDVGTDLFLGTDVVPELISGASSTIITVLNMPGGLTTGNKYVIFVVDEANIVPESDDQNEANFWVEVPTPGLLDCSTSIGLTDGVWYFDNTEINGVNNVENYHPAWEQTAPEIIHSFTAPYSGMAKLHFTEKQAGEMKAMVFPVCNENTWLAATWVNNITDTISIIDFYVSAGTEYFVVVDSKLPTQGAYGVMVELPEECVDIEIEYWGDLDLCDGDPLPSFWTYWGFPNYQWYRNGVAIPGEITSNFMPTEVGSYTVEVNENSCASQSAPIVVNMSFQPDTAIIVAAGVTTTCFPGTVQLDLDNTVIYPINWALNGELLSGENSSSLQASQSGDYTLVTTNDYCSVESNLISVTVNPLPVDIGDEIPVFADNVEFYYTFDQDNYDKYNNYSFTCWNFLPANDRNDNFWQARDFTAEDVSGYSSHSYSFPDEFTLSLWFKTSTTEGGVIASFVNSPFAPTSQEALLYMSDDGRLHYRMSNGGTPAELSSVDSYNDGQWHHVLISHGFGMLMDIDNTDEFLQISTEITHGSFVGYWTFAGPSIVGSVSSPPTSLYFDGVLDELLCINEENNHLGVFNSGSPTLDIVLLGSNTICDGGLVYFEVENPEINVDYTIWNNTLSAWHISGQILTQSSEFHFFATNPLTSCQRQLTKVINVDVYPTETPSLTILADQSGSICEGTEVNFTLGYTYAGANPVFDWYVNGVAQAVNAPAFSFTYTASTDSVWAEMLSNYECPSAALVLAGKVGFEVLPVTSPSVSIDYGMSEYFCKYDLVTLNALGTNLGASPSYQWYVDGNEYGTDSDITHINFVNTNQTIEAYLVANSDYQCSATSQAISSTVTLFSYDTPNGNMNLISGGVCMADDICFEYSGEIQNFASLEWFIDDSGTYTNLLTSGPNCYTPLTSNVEIDLFVLDINSCVDTTSYSFILSSVVSPSVSIVSDAVGIVCEGSSITFTATVINSGTSLVYQWFVNGNPVGTNSEIFTSSELEHDDEVYVQVTNTLSCASSSMVESNHILAQISYPIEPLADITWTNCIGGEVCMTYVGSTTDLDFVHWYVLGGETPQEFFGLGEHCFIVADHNVNITVNPVNIHGCYDSIFIANVIPSAGIELNMEDTTYLCANWPGPAIYTITDTYTHYNWSTGADTQTAYFNEAGTYTVTVTDDFGCTDVGILYVFEHDDVDINWTHDTLLLCTDETYILGTNNGTFYETYNWAVWYYIDNEFVNYSHYQMYSDSTFLLEHTSYGSMIITLEVDDGVCFNSDTIYVSFDYCNSIADVADSKLNVYPNPAINELVFESEISIKTISIVDVLGRIIITKEADDKYIILNIEELHPGEYYYIIKQQNDNIIKSRFVKLY